MKHPQDLHPAPEEGLRDWRQPANRNQFQVPDDRSRPVIDAIIAYAEANNVTAREALYVFAEGIYDIERHLPEDFW